MFTPTTLNTIKYTYQLNAESYKTERFHTRMSKLLTTVHYDIFIVCETVQGYQNDKFEKIFQTENQNG